MTIDEFVAKKMPTEDVAEMVWFAAFIRDGRARDPDLGLALTPESWAEAESAWSTLVSFILRLGNDPTLSFYQFVAAVEGIEPRPKLPRGRARGRTRDTTRRGH